MANSFNNFYHSVAPNKPLAAHCMDVRGHEADENSVKTAAGALGIAQDVSAGLVIARNESVFDTNLGTHAQIITRTLKLGGMAAKLHEGCGGEKGLASASEIILNNPDRMVEMGSDIIRRQITTAERDGVLRYHEYILQPGNLHYLGVEAEAAHMETDDGHDAIVRSKLAHHVLEGDTLAANHRAYTVYDAPRAYSEGHRVFNVDIWAMGIYADSLSGIYPVKADSLRASAGMRHAALMDKLGLTKLEVREDQIA